MRDRLVDDRYRLIEPLGSGGAAEVWRVRDETLGVDRALKLLNEREAVRPTARRRLRAEADALASISHPNVLRILDLGTFEGRDYLVIDLMPTGSLGDRVLANGCLSPAEATERTVEALAGLAAAHAVGIIHRDVKPTNLLLGADGRAVVADFGIALLAEGERRTRTGISMGSFAFMPPEQRLDARSVGPAADLYAVGATLYWLLIGRTPVDLFVAEADSERFAGIDPELVDVLRRATRAEPEERFRTAAEMAHALLALMPWIEERRPDLAPATFPEPLAPTATLATAADRPERPAPSRSAALRATRIGALLVAAIAGVLAIAVVARLTGLVGSGPDAPAQVEVGAVLEPPAVPTAAGTALQTALPTTTAPTEAATASAGAQTGAITTAEPEPASAPSAPPPARPAAPAPLARRWRGTLGRRDCSLILNGPDDALRGTLAVHLGESSVESEVSGTFDRATGALRLRDVHDTPDAGSYDAQRDGRALRGTFVARTRQAQLPLLLMPEDR